MRNEALNTNMEKTGTGQTRQISLRRMRVGQRGRIAQVPGGGGMTRHLQALGVRPGTMITKVSSMIMRGPVTIQVGGAQIAIGFGMAGKILVEPEAD
ncbi:ferrous iron transport protein A [Chloroflexota bacterium]